MPRDKWPLMSLQEHETYAYDIMDMLTFVALEDDPDCTLKDACREYGVSYDLVQMKAEQDPYWMDIVMMFEGIKKSDGERNLVLNLSDIAIDSLSYQTQKEIS